MRAHGISGAMVVNHFCDSYEVFEALKDVYLKNGSTYTPYEVKKVAPYKTNLLLTLEGISTPEEVTALRLSYLYAKRDDIAKGEDDYFIVDLIGLDVIDADNGTVYGKLTEMINRGASDIYVVQTKNGERMIPAVDEFIISIDINKGTFVRPIEGMLD
jgi:16S rRNA processing protein RimM